MRSINKTADAADARLAAFTPSDADPVPYRAAKLNSCKRYISSPTSFKRLTARHRPVLISTLDRSAVDMNEQNAKKEVNRKNEEKYGDDEE